MIILNCRNMYMDNKYVLLRLIIDFFIMIQVNILWFLTSFFSVAQTQLIFHWYELLWSCAPLCSIFMARFHLRQSQTYSKDYILKRLSTFSVSIVHLKKIHYWKCDPLNVYYTFCYCFRVCESVLGNCIKDNYGRCIVALLTTFMLSYIISIFHIKSNSISVCNYDTISLNVKIHVVKCSFWGVRSSISLKKICLWRLRKKLHHPLPPQRKSNT